MAKKKSKHKNSAKEDANELLWFQARAHMRLDALNIAMGANMSKTQTSLKEILKDAERIFKWLID